MSCRIRAHRVTPPQPHRSFNTLASRLNQEHHTYFRKDADQVYFPAGSKIVQQAHEPTSSWVSPSRSQSDSRIGSSLTTHYGQSGRNGSGSSSDGPGAMQIWSAFFSGFFLFPLVYSYAWAGKWAFGTKASASDVAAFEQQGLTQGSSSASNDYMDSGNLYNILQRANAETKALHDLIHLLINPEEHIHAFKDGALLEAHPIRLSSGKVLPTSKISLVIVLNKEGKTLAMLLGVDMEGNESLVSDPNLDWCQEEALREWMDERAAEVKRRDQASEVGIGLFCYTATSSATSLPGKAENWQEARLFPQDLPDGFPLKVFEHIPIRPSAEQSQQSGLKEKGP